ncbi:MAG: uracil-DNA glycosylase [Chloroflexi bacterium]|nr:uracil-DNA glycosylase [Chloroflexota bacterium]MBV9603262.1 uracil-DNA glycosylase [Chloroflexota bacterium]
MSIGTCSDERQASPLAGLTEAVLACRACQEAGFLQRANPIRPAVLDDARMVLIGQAPGPVTDRKGYHFAGPAGTFLSAWLDRAGFPAGYFREHVYLSSLTRCFPGKSASGNGDRQPSTAEIGLCRHFLDWELEGLNPRVVLLVGKMAIDAFLGKQPLERTVGRVFSVHGRVFVPLPHASGVSRWLNTPAHRALLDQALGELSRLRVELNL